MARIRKALPAQLDIAYLISAGVLASVCPRTLIDEVLAETGKASQRLRLLPAPAVVYYIMALALWRECQPKIEMSPFSPSRDVPFIAWARV